MVPLDSASCLAEVVRPHAGSAAAPVALLALYAVAQASAVPMAFHPQLRTIPSAFVIARSALPIAVHLLYSWVTSQGKFFLDLLLCPLLPVLPHLSPMLVFVVPCLEFVSPHPAPSSPIIAINLHLVRDLVSSLLYSWCLEQCLRVVIQTLVHTGHLVLFALFLLEVIESSRQPCTVLTRQKRKQGV